MNSIWSISVKTPKNLISRRYQVTEPNLDTRSASQTPNILTASKPALVALFTATVATGTPLGICIINTNSIVPTIEPNPHTILVKQSIENCSNEKKNETKHKFIGKKADQSEIICTCTMDKRESIPSNVEARTGTPITGKGVRAATMPAKLTRQFN